MSSVSNSSIYFTRTSNEELLIGHTDNTKPSLQIDRNGIVKEPYKPFFNVCNSANQPNKTSRGDFAQIIPDRVISNIGGYYNVTSGKFKAPENGVYFINARVLLTNLPDMRTNARLSATFENVEYHERDVSFSSLPYTISVFATQYLKKGEEFLAKASAAVQATVSDQVGFGGDPVKCLTGISGGLL